MDPIKKSKKKMRNEIIYLKSKIIIIASEIVTLRNKLKEN